MAGAHDVFLYSVPSDADSDDVRLRDPTVAGAGGGNATVLPGAGQLIITGQAPAASASSTVSPAVGALVINGQAPAVSASSTVSPAAGTLVITGKTPNVAAGSSASPATGQIIVTGKTPSVSAGATIIPFPGILTATGFAPTVTASANLTGSTGVRRLASSRAYAWNADRISAMLLSVRSLMGQVETAAKQPESATPARIEIPEELAEIALSTAAKPQRVDFIPTSVPFAAMNAASLLGELKSIEARLEALERAAIAREDHGVDDEDAALILLGMPRRPRAAPVRSVAANADDDDIAMILLAA